MPEATLRKLARWKDKLLDVSRRNRLIDFRPTRSTTVRIVDERPAEIFRLLVTEGATLSFRAAPEEAPREETRVHTPYRREDLPGEQTDRVLGTDLVEAYLDHNLLQIYRKAVSVREEHGYNTLFLALGFLEWTETATAETVLKAPLLLVPVDLGRVRAGDRFRLRALEDDPLVNPALARRMAKEFAFEFPALPEDLDGYDALGFFDAVAAGAAAFPRWRVTNGAALAHFSFAKFVMYKDLEEHAAAFAEHPLLACVAGDPAAPPPAAIELPRGEELDRLPLERTFQVMDADSSQQEAIEAVKRGRSLVIEGPPGTGKSQTIANMIVESLLAGRSVLFVSEKMAALRVVHDRLRDAGLADFCLELHSQKSSRRAVLEELRRTLDLPSEAPGAPQEAIEDLARTREELNAYVRELRDPVPPLGRSPYEAIGRLAGLRGDGAPDVPLFLGDAATWTRERWEAGREAIERLTRAVPRVEPIAEHPWRGCLLREGAYGTQVRLRAALEEWISALDEARARAAELAARIGAGPPATMEATRALAELGALLVESPSVEPERARDLRWDAAEPEGRRMLADLRAYREAIAELGLHYGARILEGPVEEMQEWWRAHGAGAFRFLRPSYWTYKGMLDGWRKAGAPEDPVRALELAVKARAVRARLRAADGTWFGARWRAEESDPEALAAFAGWMIRFRRLARAGYVPESAYPLAQRGLPAKAEASALAAAVARLVPAWDAFAAIAAPKDPPVDLGEERRRAEARRAALDRVEDWAAYQDALAGAAAANGREFWKAAGTTPTAAFPSAWERAFWRSWLEGVRPARPRLAAFERERHEAVAERFRALDRGFVALNRRRARAALLARKPDRAWEAAPGSELGILQREVRKKRGHPPLRRLFAEVAEPIRRLKPCFMMSPITVAQHLDPAGPAFDLVVFDEASQIAPEDAIGVIARGKQLIVVGDAKQLPPTPFWRVELLEDGVEETELGEGDLESILEECAAVFPDRRQLRWHYRSRREGLIAFSNRTYYENRLLTFPAPDEGGESPGVRFVHVADGVYDRGGSKTNRREAARVAGDLFRFLRENPGRSVGVGAFSVAQQQAIEDELERLRREDAALESRFDPATPEYCFVKNLETIQGDERDVIFLSVGYGRDAAGKMSLNFGPLNQQGGPRRLNVLVTRAREEVRLFSSITAEDLDVSRTAAPGVHDLRRYLDYAQRGPDALPPEPVTGAGAAAGRMEDAVLEFLTARGLSVARRVGCSGYRIDLAVVEDGRYLLGIECDGPTYQGAPTARDRDRLRAQVLEALGWRLHRIWSVDWQRQPEREVERVEAAVRSARAAGGRRLGRADSGAEPTGRPAPPAPPPPDSRRPPAPVAPEARTPGGATAAAGDDSGAAPEDVTAYTTFPVQVLGDGEAMHRDLRQVARVLERVVACEGPVHREEAARRVAAHWGLTRLGSRIQETFDRATGRCAAEGALVARGEFLWPPAMTAPPIRRRDTDGAPREAHLIAPEEIAAAALLVLRKEYRMREEDLVDRVGRLFGFARSGPRVRDAVRAGLEVLRRGGRLEEADGSVREKPSAPEARP